MARMSRVEPVKTMKDQQDIIKVLGDKVDEMIRAQKARAGEPNSPSGELQSVSPETDCRDPLSSVKEEQRPNVKDTSSIDS